MGAPAIHPPAAATATGSESLVTAVVRLRLATLGATNGLCARPCPEACSPCAICHAPARNFEGVAPITDSQANPPQETWAEELESNTVLSGFGHHTALLTAAPFHCEFLAETLWNHMLKCHSGTLRLLSCALSFLRACECCILALLCHIPCHYTALGRPREGWREGSWEAQG